MTQIRCPDHGMTKCTNTIRKDGVRGAVCEKCFAKFKGKWEEEGLEVMIKIKPLSVNEAFQGRRFKTPEYKAYEQELLFKLPNKVISKKAHLKLEIEVGFSNSGSDLSNIIKPFEDVLQKKYGFNDNHVYEIKMKKIIVGKGLEYIRFSIIELDV